MVDKAVMTAVAHLMVEELPIKQIDIAFALEKAVPPGGGDWCGFGCKAAGSTCGFLCFTSVGGTGVLDPEGRLGIKSADELQELKSQLPELRVLVSAELKVATANYM